MSKEIERYYTIISKQNIKRATIIIIRAPSHRRR